LGISFACQISDKPTVKSEQKLNKYTSYHNLDMLLIKKSNYRDTLVQKAFPHSLVITIVLSFVIKNSHAAAAMDSTERPLGKIGTLDSEEDPENITFVSEDEFYDDENIGGVGNVLRISGSYVTEVCNSYTFFFLFALFFTLLLVIIVVFVTSSNPP
jgi:hypothetical protein